MFVDYLLFTGILIFCTICAFCIIKFSVKRFDAGFVQYGVTFAGFVIVGFIAYFLMDVFCLLYVLRR